MAIFQHRAVSTPLKMFLVIKNYCYPKKRYIARSFTLISKEFGMVELYEEDFDFIIQRKVTLDEFPEFMANTYRKT